MQTPLAYSRFTRAQLGSAAVLAVLLVAVAMLLNTQPAAAQTDVTVEILRAELDHHTPYKVKITGVAELQEFTIRNCYSNLTGPQCAGGFGGYRLPEVDPRITLQAKRLLVVDEQVVDCAVAAEPCWLELATGDTVVRTQLVFSDALPVPEVYIESDVVVVGDPVTITTNQYFGDRKLPNARLSDDILQCPPRKTIVNTRECTTLAMRVSHGEAHSVVPRRTLVSGRKLFDCAAQPGSCEIMLGYAQRTGTPLTFADPATPLPKQSIAMDQTDNLANFGTTNVVVTSSLASEVRVSQCAKKVRAEARGMSCNLLKLGYLTGDPTGETVDTAITVRPRRHIFARNTRSLDCNSDGVKCFVRVTAQSSKHRIGKRIPITFDATEQVGAPRVTIPDGPFADGEIIEIRVENLAPGMGISVRCQSQLNGFCAAQIRATADENGTAIATITLNKVEACTGSRPCKILVTTNPRTITFQKFFSFE